ncbi:MAG: hypothetical protein AB7P40_08885 [Chloroflexota bacterium]
MTHWKMTSEGRGRRPGTMPRLAVILIAVLLSLTLGMAPARAADTQPPIILTPTVNGTVAGWLVDFADERNYMLNTYLQHLDYLAADPAYTLAVTDAPVMIALLELAPERAPEVRRFLEEGRLEFANAFFLSAALGLTGGEALLRLGIEGVRWQEAQFGARPRTLWLVDSTGIPEQMPQIAATLGVRGIVFTRGNQMPTATFQWFAPDNSSVAATASGVYAHLPELFLIKHPLGTAELGRIDAAVQGFERFETPGAPTFWAAGSGDYGLPPAAPEQASRFVQQWRQLHPDQPVTFGTPDAYFRELAATGASLPRFEGEVPYGFGAFWVNIPSAKQGARMAEHRLQAAEGLASVASLTTAAPYPAETLADGWMNLFVNMDRSALWGVGAGSVFESATVWDVQDRFAAISAATQAVTDRAFGSLLALDSGEDGQSVTVFNPLNWDRTDPVVLRTPGGRGLESIPCQPLDDPEAVLCMPSLPAFGAATFNTSERPLAPTATGLRETFETAQYSVSFDPQTGDLRSVRLKANGAELLAGPGNAIVVEGLPDDDPGVDTLPPRARRHVTARASDTVPTWSVTEGDVATTIVASQLLPGVGTVRREVRLYQDHPRIDFTTTLTDIADGSLVLADFPLDGFNNETARGVPYGFAERHPGDVITPAIRWSSYELAGGSTVALLDVGTPAREINGGTISMPLLNAHSAYRGLPNASLSGNGQHTFRYALVGATGDWRTAGIPQLAWEFNTDPLAQAGALPNSQRRSWLSTTDNVTVTAVRRVGSELEIRLVDWTGQGGSARVEVGLPHSTAFLTDALGEHREPLAGGPGYDLSLRPQQIVTLRLTVDAAAIPDVPPLTSFRGLAPPQKQASLEIRHQKAGHPPEVVNATH